MSHNLKISSQKLLKVTPPIRMFETSHFKYIVQYNWLNFLKQRIKNESHNAQLVALWTGTPLVLGSIRIEFYGFHMVTNRIFHVN